MGASPATMNVAMDGLRQSEQRFQPQAFVPDPIVQQQQAILAMIMQQSRPVDVRNLNLTGLWINPQGFWMQVTRSAGKYSYVGRDILNNVCENGTMSPSGNAVVCLGRNATIGDFSAEFTVINEDLLVYIANGVAQAVLRRLPSTG
jgi:hypothetical protein